MLLPDPTQREVVRQIRERSADALKALENARRQAPFLSKWKHYPNFPASSLGDWEVRRIADAEWSGFLNQFEVVKLGYDDIEVKAVMDWYDATRAPFGKGKKRKEFPDAFAVAILASYAAKNHAYIAVVAADDDFKNACTHYHSLLHFPSLPSLTELLLADAVRIVEIKKAVDESGDLLADAVAEAAGDLYFYHADSRYEEIEEVDSLEFAIEEVRVVGLGVNECTVTFAGNLTFRARLRWQEEIGHDDTEWESGWIRDGDSISGTAKLRLAGVPLAIEEVGSLELDNVEIEVTVEPW